MYNIFKIVTPSWLGISAQAQGVRPQAPTTIPQLDGAEPEPGAEIEPEGEPQSTVNPSSETSKII